MTSFAVIIFIFSMWTIIISFYFQIKSQLIWPTFHSFCNYVKGQSQFGVKIDKFFFKYFGLFVLLYESRLHASTHLKTHFRFTYIHTFICFIFCKYVYMYLLVNMSLLVKFVWSEAWFELLAYNIFDFLLFFLRLLSLCRSLYDKYTKGIQT